MPSYGAPLPASLANDPEFMHQTMRLTGGGGSEFGGNPFAQQAPPPAQSHQQMHQQEQAVQQQLIEQTNSLKRNQTTTLKSILLAAFVMSSVTAWGNVLEESFKEYYPMSKSSRISAFAVFAALITALTIVVARYAP